MIGCYRARRRMWLMFGRDLSEGTAAKLEAHLTKCERCRARFAELKGWMGEVRGLASEKVEPRDHQWFWTRLKSRLRSEIEVVSRPAPTVFRRWVLKWAPLPLTAAVLLGLVIGIAHYRGEDEKVQSIGEQVVSYKADENIVTVDLTQERISDSDVVIYQTPDQEMTIIYFLENGD